MATLGRRERVIVGAGTVVALVVGGYLFLVEPLLMRARDGKSERELIRAVGEGIYVGRVWYTYPINGQRAGDFTCTVSGDSYLIRDGVLAAPLAPNALRINANIEQVFAHPIGVGNRAEPALVWGAPEAYYVSALAAGQIPFAAIDPSSSVME